MSVKPWSETEQALARALVAGQKLDLSRGAGDSKVRAVVVRDLLLGRAQGPNGTGQVHPDPQGLRLNGATILGHLDLDYIDGRIPLLLTRCVIEDGLSLRHAHFPILNLNGSRLGSREIDGAVNATQIKTEHDFSLAGTMINSHSRKQSALRLDGAHIGGRLILDGASLGNDLGSAVDAVGSFIQGDVSLEATKMTGSHQYGVLLVAGAHIGGDLNLNDAVMSNDAGPAINAASLTTDGHLSAEIKDATGNGPLSTVRLHGAHVRGQLILNGAMITNPAGPAITADALIVDGGAYMDNLRATGNGSGGAIRLLTAHIGGQLGLRNAILSSNAGPALNADGLIVDGGMLIQAIHATGTGPNAAIRLINARIQQELVATSAKLVNASGPALMAYRLIVDGQALLNSLTATGNSVNAAVSLGGGDISADLVLDGAVLTNRFGPALNAQDITVHGNANLQLASSTGCDPDGVINLRGARVDGLLYSDFTAIQANDPSQRLLLDGLTYRGLPNVDVENWLNLIRDSTPRYAAHPYRQLAAMAASEGHDAVVRRILISQREDQLRRATSRLREKAWGWFTGITLGYGYQPWRALIGLVLVTITSAVLTFGLGSKVLVHPNSHPPSGCTSTERLALGVDNALPLITTSFSSSCVLKTGPWPSTREVLRARVITWTAITAQILGWAFTTLFVAGFTAAVRKT